MLEILIFKLLPWAGLLSGASFALIVLMTAFWAGQEERSAGWAWCLFALFSSLPLLAVLALRLFGCDGSRLAGFGERELCLSNR